MRYLGGKARTAKPIAQFLMNLREDGQSYWEPFVGAGWVLSRIHSGERYASDFSLPLISMWSALVNGWTPPTHVSEAEYANARLLPDTNPLKAFVGFGCSFSGKYFGGYARDNTGRNYARNAHNSIMKKVNEIGTDANFFNADFMNTNSPQSNMLVYCDPPYKNTTGYSTGEFDHAAFWDKCLSLSTEGNTVVVSEYEAPEPFECVLEIATKTDMREKSGRSKRTEKLFVLRGTYKGDRE